ncbi:fanconi anemia group J protein [Phthorimaea operculella]|nr:fanconi anemia group J protein [Phthorimaea operculella]
MPDNYSFLEKVAGLNKSAFQWVEKDTLSLKLLCLNSAVVFTQLQSARCILLASGTLTPLVSLHSELGTDFPLQISPNHVIPADRSARCILLASGTLTPLVSLHSELGTDFPLQISPNHVIPADRSARCILLASGTLTPLVSLHSELGTDFPLQISPNHVIPADRVRTLTPLVSLHSELGTDFPLQISPNHVIPADRVWIGTLTTCPNGYPLKCTAGEADQALIQDSLGDAVRWVCQVTPNGVLVFLPSYALMNKLCKRWQETGMWRKLNDLKHVFMESRNTRDHNDIMEDFYECVESSKGALLFAVYRGKVSEGMDFKDHQARAVVTIGVPFPNTFDQAVKEKMNYNDKYAKQKNLLTSREWLRVQAYRALNQAVGRCVRHRNDWGAVLLIDSRFQQNYYTEHLSKWVRKFLGNNHHTYESLVNSPTSLETFMRDMAIREHEDHN